MSNRTNSRVAGGASTSNSKGNKSEYFTDLSEITVGTIFIRENLDNKKDKPICQITDVVEKNIGEPYALKSIKYINLSKKNNNDTKEMTVIIEGKKNNKDVAMGFYGNTKCYLKKPTEAQLNEINKNRAGGASASNLKTNIVAGGAGASKPTYNKSEYFTDLSQITVGTIFIREKQSNKKDNTRCKIISVEQKNIGTDSYHIYIKYLNLDRNNKIERVMELFNSELKGDRIYGYAQRMNGIMVYFLKRDKASNLKTNKNRAGGASASNSKNNKKGTFIFIPNQNGNSGNVGQIIGTKQNKNIVTIIFRNVQIIDKTLTYNI